MHRARAIVLSTGSAARYLNLPDEQRLIGRGVSACATCDGFFFRDQDILVVGGGDSAMEEATFLTRFARSVTIVHRRDEFRASAIMLDRARKDPKIQWITNAAITALHGETSVTGVTLTDTVTGAADASWRPPACSSRSGTTRGPTCSATRSPPTREGYVLTGRAVGATASTGTSIEGVFASGDLVDHTYRQAITAAGSGCAAALDAQHYLASHPLTGRTIGRSAGITTDPMPETCRSPLRGLPQRLTSAASPARQSAAHTTAPSTRQGRSPWPP